MGQENRATDKNNNQAGHLTVLRLAIELGGIYGVMKIGESISLQWGDIGRASAGDLGWLMGLFLGAFAIYIIEATTIGLHWPQSKSMERNPEPLSIILSNITLVSIIAVGSCSGLVLFSWLGAWIGGVVGFLLLIPISHIRRFLK